jgi:hypothetical protein
MIKRRMCAFSKRLVPKYWLVTIVLYMSGAYYGFSQTRDSLKVVRNNSNQPYFIISAGEVINAYFNDKPVEVETISEFNTYVQTNVKILKDSWVVVTGKPKAGTFDDVLKTLSHYRFKHVSKNILAN